MHARENNLKRVVFLGSDAICLPALTWLKARHLGGLELIGIISQPNRRQGRGQKCLPNPVADFANRNGIALLQPEKPGKDLSEWMRSNSVDIAFVMAYGHYIGKSLREAPELGMVNFHASILPKYRGASPIETAIACGETQTGVSLMQVDAKMDSGAVSAVEYVPILDEEDAASLREKLGDAVVLILERCFESLCQGQLLFEPQKQVDATYCRKLTKEDGLIDFSLPSKAIFDRWRAFKTWPTSYCFHKDQRIKVGRMQCISGDAFPGQASGRAGMIHRFEDRVWVETGDGFIELIELQRPGGKMLPAPDFLRGYCLKSGDQLSGGASDSLVYTT